MADEKVETLKEPKAAYTVISPFADYKVGDVISDEKAIADLLKSENAHFCVKSK